MTKADKDMRRARAALVAVIETEVAETSYFLGKETLDPRVVAAMARVPRHRFVPEANQGAAYENRPQPIGHGQTISQPYMVAVMTDLVAPGPDDKVLEIGTGCGYQTAILAELAAAVYSIEVVAALAGPAGERLKGLGYHEVKVRTGDGALGWPEHAPYEAIVVTAAAWHRVPPALTEQLAPGGRLVIPVDRSRAAARYPFASQDQELLLITKDLSGRLSERAVLPVSFVPLVEGGKTALRR